MSQILKIRGHSRQLPWAPRIDFTGDFFVKINIIAKLLSVLIALATINGCSNAQGVATPKMNVRDTAAIAEAERGIERYRKGDARVELRGFSGRGLRVRIRQLTHDFKFGCYLKIDNLTPEQTETYEKYFARLFNYAVIGTYWDVTENQRGVHYWREFDKEFAMARRNEWRIQAAPVLWGTNQAGTPAWLPKDRSDLMRTVSDRIGRVFKSNGTATSDVEIVNEPLAPSRDVFADRLGPTYIDEAFRTARSLAPSSRLMINEYGVFGTVSENNYNNDAYFDLVRTMISRGVPVDVVGIQAHANREWYSPSDVAGKLDQYARLGKPIQISEFSAQTKNYDDRKTFERILGAYRAGSWTEEKQAEFYREFYTIAFGHPAVEAIVQWGLDDTRSWLPGIGVIGEDLKPKPNYEVLDELINNRWRTNLEMSPGPANFAEFRGFFGVYEIEVIDDRKVVATDRFELRRDTNNRFVLTTQ